MAYVTSVPFLMSIAVFILSACGGAETQAPQATLDQSAIDAQAAASIAAKTDKTGPEIINVSASTSRITAPNSVSLTASVRDLNSGVLKVEFYKVGVRTPIDIKTSPPYTTSIPLGVADQGTNSYYIKAYDMAVNWLGLLEPNTSDSVKSPTTISVDIPSNTLKYGGTLKDIIGPTATTDIETIQVGALLNNAVSGSRFYIVGNINTTISGYGNNTLYEIDYVGKSLKATKLPDDAQYGFPSRNLLAIDPKDFNRMLFVSNSPQYMSGYPTTNKPIFESRDAASTWKKIAEIRSGSQSFRYIKISDFDGELLAYTNDDGSYSSGGGDSSTGSFARSSDSGLTWRYAPAGLNYYSSTSEVKTSRTGSAVFLRQESYRPVFRSADTSAGFIPCGQIGSELFRSAFQVAPDNQDNLIATTSASGYIFRSTDGCSTWSKITLPSPLEAINSNPSPFPEDPPGKLIYSTHVPGLVYLLGRFGRDGGSLLRSTDGGLTWSIRSYFDPTSRGAAYRTAPREAIITKPNSQGELDLIILAKIETTENNTLRLIDKLIILSDNISQP